MKMPFPLGRISMVASALFVATPSAAHVVFAEPAAQAGGYYAGFLRVSHGCGPAATVEVQVDIPESIITARPQPKPGWRLSIKRAPLAQPAAGEGGAQVTERVASITWTGTLPADQFDQFGIMMKLPAQAGPLYFPTRQRCTSGSNDWVNIPASPDAWHATAMPAPMLMLKPVEPTDHAHPSM